MAGNLVYMALDSLLEGEDSETVVNRLMHVLTYVEQRRRLREQQNNGGTGANGGSSMTGLNGKSKLSGNKLMGKGVVHALHTAYRPDECALKYPPATKPGAYNKCRKKTDKTEANIEESDARLRAAERRWKRDSTDKEAIYAYIAALHNNNVLKKFPSKIAVDRMRKVLSYGPVRFRKTSKADNWLLNNGWIEFYDDHTIDDDEPAVWGTDLAIELFYKRNGSFEEMWLQESQLDEIMQATHKIGYVAFHKQSTSVMTMLGLWPFNAGNIKKLLSKLKVNYKKIEDVDFTYDIERNFLLMFNSRNDAKNFVDKLVTHVKDKVGNTQGNVHLHASEFIKSDEPTDNIWEYDKKI